jgi:hypothetical protein
MENLKSAVASALAILNPHRRAFGEEGPCGSSSSRLRGDLPKQPASVHAVSVSRTEGPDKGGS